VVVEHHPRQDENAIRMIGFERIAAESSKISELLALPTPPAQLPLVARAVWEPRSSLATSAECWLEAGSPRHTLLSRAIGIEELTDAPP
jgi:hypothetical protein